MNEYVATVPDAWSWESQVCQYQDAPRPPVEDLPCITYYAGEVPYAEPVDCLLYWVASASGKPMIVGILNHYPVNYGRLERAGAVNVWVRRPNQRQGIATTLIIEAVRRWDIDPRIQRFTRDGAEFVRHLSRLWEERRRSE